MRPGIDIGDPFDRITVRFSDLTRPKSDISYSPS